jgi:type IV pilus assembly protein PilQ
MGLRTSVLLTSVLLTTLISSLGIDQAYAAEIVSIDFTTERKDEGEESVISVQGNGPLFYLEEYDSINNQLILDLEGSTFGPRASRPLDTSSFTSPVLLINPYPAESGVPAQLVIQFREFASPEVSSDGNRIRIRIPHYGSVAARSSAESYGSSVEADRLLDQYFQNQGTDRFQGTPITLRVRDAEVRDVLRLIGEASGFNMVIGPDVSGRLSLALEDVPWDQVLNIILKSLNLGAERNNNVLKIMTLRNMTEQRQAEMQAIQALEQSAPRVTRVFPISYAEIDVLRSILMTFGSARQGGAEAVIEADNRTNSLIIQDTFENLERMQRLVELLDQQTPQVLVEAKVVEASENFSKNMSGRLGLGINHNEQQGFASFNGGRPFDDLLGGTEAIFPGGDAISSASGALEGGGLFGFSPTIGRLGMQRINAILSLAESEEQVKVISSPKTVVLNKQSATILQSTPVLIPTTAFSDGTPIVTNEIVDANLSLTVTPTVTNDEKILMDLNIDRDIPFGGAIARRSLNTHVLVENGNTLVIGGVYTMDQQNSHSGFPILKDLPILGILFGNKTGATSRSELFIFVTPRILNPQEMAGVN